jgi:FKBP-type peptidyl-prolyl cis-trans isomerase
LKLLTEFNTAIMTRIVSIIVCLSALLACHDIQSQKEIIETTKSGYRYQLSKDMPGTPVHAGQYVLVHSVVCHQDTVISDTRVSPGRPVIVRVDDPAARKQSGSGPLQDLLELLSVGDSARLYYPVDSFPIKPHRIRGYKEVTYDITVVDIFETEEEVQAYKAAEREQVNAPMHESQKKAQSVGQSLNAFYQAYKDGQKDDKWQTTNTGLKYIILEKSGTGIKAKAGELVRAHYYGIFEADGQKFDTSFDRGETLDFNVGTGVVIKGWDEAFQIIEKGDKAVILVPGELAYGSRGYPGVIPPNTDLIFYIELVGLGELD